MNFIKTFLAGVLAFFTGMFLMFFFWIFLLVGIAGSMDKGVEVPEEAVLKIDFSELVTDSPSADPLSNFDFMSMKNMPELTLFNALRAIDAAKEDERIKGIYLRMNGGGGATGAAVLEELREALVGFKESGKFVVAYNEVYSQGDYYLASAADRIYLQPQGGIEWAGMAANLMFYKGLMDKLDVKAEVFRPTVCKYKSAVEPYILDKMSPANREQMQQLVDSMWDTVAGAVAEARGIELEELNRLTDKLEVSLAGEALEHRFVDGLIYEDQVEDVFAELGVDTEDYGFVTLSEYAAQQTFDPSSLSSDEVTIVYADGNIVDGSGSGKEIFGNTLAETLAGVREDDQVKAVVLRVNSPGGSALASDVIWREMELLKAEKPVVVSMGSYAASGGYYISCPADVIVADKLTLTGSIGVFGLIFNTHDALKNKLGITFDGVTSNESSSFLTLSPLQRAMIMRGVDQVYETFTTNVSKGRNLPLERVLEIAGGRVWSGENALGIGLVDTCGGLKTAIALAADKAGLGEEYRVTETVEAPDGFLAILASLNTRVKAAAARAQFGLFPEEYEQLRSAVEQQGVMMYTPYRVELR